MQNDSEPFHLTELIMDYFLPYSCCFQDVFLEIVINNKQHISISNLYLSLDLYSHPESSDDISALIELSNN